jgi:predicted nucleic acid-binding protein
MILLDTNIALEAILSGRVKKDLALEYLVREDVAFSSLSAHLIGHIASREGLLWNTTLYFMARLKFLPLDQAAIDWAIEHAEDKDLETL